MQYSHFYASDEKNFVKQVEDPDAIKAIDDDDSQEQGQNFKSSLFYGNEKRETMYTEVPIANKIFGGLNKLPVKIQHRKSSCNFSSYFIGNYTGCPQKGIKTKR